MTHAPTPRMRRRTLLAAAAVAPFAAPSQAQDAWPSRPVTIVSPYAPGGTNDTVARLVADRLQKALGQPFVVDNKPGAAGIVGAKLVMGAKPDGYTLLAGNNGGLIVQAAGRLPSPYDPATQLTPIMKVATAMQFISVSSDLPVRTIGELIAHARKNPGKLNFSSAGVGSFGHFLAEYLQMLAGIELVHVPARGSAAALTEMMAHRVHMMIDPLPLTQAADNRIRILCTVSPQRYEAYPQYPTIRESGGPDLDLTGWFGLQGPTGLPPDVVSRIVAVGRTLDSDAEARKTLTTGGLIAAHLSGPAFLEQIQGDLKKVADIRARARIVIE